ncbi:FHA domain-containing protein, partial [Thermogemmatispora sp.]
TLPGIMLESAEAVEVAPPHSSGSVSRPMHEQSTLIEAPAITEKAPSRQVPAQLVHLTTGEIFPLSRPEMIIGRRDPIRNLYPDISLADKMVGRRHACIRNRQGTFTIEDLHSRNRTRLNGNFLPPGQERSLKHGDILRFGNIEMRFELINGHQPSAQKKE